MIQVLYDSMAIPNSCYLGKRIYKKLFHENAKLSATDKKAFREDIDSIIWQYTLKPSTIPIKPFTDEEREYLEIAIIQVNLKTQHRTGRIAEIIHRAIPYPLVVLFAYETKFLLSLATKRFSQAERGAIVADEFFATEWINLLSPTPIQKDFLASLAISALPHTHFFALYSALVDRLVALDSARLTNEYRLEPIAAKRTDRRKRLAACHELETKIAEYKVAIKKETQFNRQVEMNTMVNELNERLSALVKGL